MKRILLSTIAMLFAVVAQAQCDWSGYWMKKVNQQQNVYTFKTNVDGDPCIDYHWIVYDYQLKRQDTIQDFGGITQVQLNVKGKYKFMLNAVNTCRNCDTTFVYEIDMTIYGKADVTWNVGAHNCKYHSFQMTDMQDTCIEYYYAIYKDTLFDELGAYWDTAKDIYLWLYNNYDFAEEDLVFYNLQSQRTVNHTFTDSGRHLIWSYWYNKCTGIDTWVMKKLEVCPKAPVLGISKITKSGSPRLVGVYDLMGRPVYHIREDEVLVYVYSDGTRKKVVRSSR